MRKRRELGFVNRVVISDLFKKRTPTLQTMLMQQKFEGEGA